MFVRGRCYTGLEGVDITTGLEGVDGLYRQCRRWDGVQIVSQRDVLLRAKHFFNINPGFGAIRPITFASMGPTFNQEAKSKKLY